MTMERRGLKQRVMGALRATLRRSPCSASSRSLREIAYEPSLVSIAPPSPRQLSRFWFGDVAEELRKAEEKMGQRKKKTKRKRRKLLTNSYGFTSSSSCRDDSDDDDDDDDGETLFSSDETLLSSRSFSSDSSEFYYYSRPVSSKRRKKPARKMTARISSKRWRRRASSVSSSSPFSGHGGFAVAVKEIAQAGFAVEKFSSDPREDFRCSMLEMIMEQQMFGEAEMEALLRSYLSLNPPSHHRTIIEVFWEIRETLFGETFLS
ncbi:uncharacterized protein LOC144701139 [Wolffia australiana]